MMPCHAFISFSSRETTHASNIVTRVARTASTLMFTGAEMMKHLSTCKPHVTCVTFSCTFFDDDDKMFAANFSDIVQNSVG